MTDFYVAPACRDCPTEPYWNGEYWISRSDYKVFIPCEEREYCGGGKDSNSGVDTGDVRPWTNAVRSIGRAFEALDEQPKGTYSEPVRVYVSQNLRGDDPAHVEENK